MKNWTRATLSPQLRRPKMHSGPHQKKSVQQVKGDDPVSLLCPCENPHGALHADLGFSAQERYEPFGGGTEEYHKDHRAYLL